MNFDPAALAAALQLRRVGPGSWRGNCPSCAYSSDVFSLKAGDGGKVLWHCASCGDGAAISRVLRSVQGDDGWTPPPARTRAPSSPTSTAEKVARAMRLWSDALPLEGSPAEIYLRARGVLSGLHAFAQPEVPVLRWHPAVPHPEVHGRHHAMLALMADPVTGQPTGAHRTYLRPDGAGKSAMSPQKASVGAVGVIQLHKHQADLPLVIAEGLETALAASLILGAPCWAAVSCGAMARLMLPEEVRHVVIAADGDPPGQKAARAAAWRWRGEGRRVEIAIPDEAGQDFNDLLAEREGRDHG